MSILLLMKFGQESHIKDLHEEGHIYMNLLSSNKADISNKQRFDKLEGSISNLFISEGILELKFSENEDWKKLAIFNTHFNQYLDATKFYSYSLYSVTLQDLEDERLFRVDAKMNDFGTHFIMINNTVNFLKRIEFYLKENNYEYYMCRCSYYNSKETQNNLSLFNKSDEYKHQKEFRIIVKAKSKVPLQINIGPLKDQSEVYSSKILQTMVMKL